MLSPLGRKNCWTVIFSAPRVDAFGSDRKCSRLDRQALDRALAMCGRVADDQSAAIILYGAGQDFAGTGAQLAGDHDQADHPKPCRDRSSW